jgi:hypothetical protein
MQRKNLAIGKHLLHRGDVTRVDQGQLLEFAHAAGALGAGEMAFAGMRADNFAGPRKFKALGGAAMRFQFFLWLSRVSWHCRNLSTKFYTEPNLQAGCAACCGLGFATGAPFLGASSATKTFPSMRGIVSIWPKSPISLSRRVILARPTSWCAISRPR